VLSSLFRRLFLEGLAEAYAAGKLQFFGDLEPLRDPHCVAISNRRLLQLEDGQVSFQ
jgi:hypothetical protein